MEFAKDDFIKKAQKMFARNDELSFLLIGRTGVGKSSTINSLLGEEVAPVGKYQPTTMDVDTYHHKHGELTYTILDTPGLCDDLPENGKDEEYLEKIKLKVKSVDSIWFVTKLDDSRIGADEKRGIKLISEALGNECWSKAVIIFTRSDKSDSFAEDLENRSSIIRDEIGKYFIDSKNIPVVAVSNTSELLPNGKPWLPELFTQVFLRFSDEGALPFLKSMENDIGANYFSGKQKKEEEKQSEKKQEEEKKKEEKPRVELSPEQKEKIKESAFNRVMKGASTGALIGQKVGKPFGKVGEAVGAGVGAIIGGIGGWLFG